MEQKEIENEKNNQEQCAGSCNTCSANCSSRKPSREELLEPANKHSKIRRVIGVVSGKGGVGKSFITSYLAVNMNRKGYRTAILDADVTGPSIPKSFGIHKKVKGNELGISPEYSKNGTAVMSVNLLIDKEETPVVWRGAVIAATVKQFWTEVVWGDVDYMFVDMPPGTGDVPLTVFQSIPLDGIVIVTSPQELVSMIVKKAVNMANAMEIPILGIVENYSYVTCDCCGKKINVFGESHVEEVADEFQLKVLGKLPLDSSVAEKIDKGEVEDIENDWLCEAVDFVEESCPVNVQEEMERSMKIAVALGQDGQVAEKSADICSLCLFSVEKQAVKKEEEISYNKDENIVEMCEQKKIDILFCGGIGHDILSKMMKQHIMVVPGQQGNAEQVIADFLKG